MVLVCGGSTGLAINVRRTSNKYSKTVSNKCLTQKAISNKCQKAISNRENDRWRHACGGSTGLAINVRRTSNRCWKTVRNKRQKAISTRLARFRRNY